MSTQANCTSGAAAAGGLNRIVLANPVFQAFRKQRALPAIRALNKRVTPHTLHRGDTDAGAEVSGDALGVVTAASVRHGLPDELGFLAVLSVEGIVKCLEHNDLYPEVQRKYHDAAL